MEHKTELERAMCYGQMKAIIQIMFENADVYHDTDNEFEHRIARKS